jgi:hypothetical protein
MRKFGLVFTSLLLALVAVSTVSAKWDPRVEAPGTDWGGLAQAWQAPDALTSYAQFGRLDTYGDVDAFSFTFAGPVQSWPARVSVPVCGPYFADFYPTMALIGPGLDVPEAGSLPFDLPEGMGAQVLTEANQDTPRQVASEDYFSEGYLSTPHHIAIPQAGTYTIALFEPHNNVGAYLLVTGSGEPDFTGREQEIGNTYTELSSSNAWMGQDCGAPATTVAASSCPATQNISGSVAEPAATPVRWQVGTGFILDGDVMDSATCAPLANAQIQFWMANPDGVYDAAHAGTLFTNGRGMYRIESDRPGAYGDGDAHIHLIITVPGYQPLETVFLLPDGSDTGSFPIVLKPE